MLSSYSSTPIAGPIAIKSQGIGQYLDLYLPLVTRSFGGCGRGGGQATDRRRLVGLSLAVSRDAPAVAVAAAVPR
jgi:hypothetical protein